MDLLVHSEKQNLIKLIDNVVGVNTIIDYNNRQFRLGCFVSYEQAIVVPALHRNVLSMYNMKKP